MIDKGFFEGMYDDFFGIRKIQDDLINENKEIPEIKVKSETEKVELTKENKDRKMAELFERIDDLYITEESKNTLKKMIEYMRKYNEGLQDRFISFDMCIYSKDNKAIDEIGKIILEAAVFFDYLKSERIAKASLLNLENVNQIGEVYKSKLGMAMFSNMEIFNTLDEKEKLRFVLGMEQIMKEQEGKSFTVFTASSKETIQDMLSRENNTLKNNFDFEIVSTKPTVQDIYQELLNKLEEKEELTEEFKVKLLEYVTETYPNTDLDYSEYIEKLYTKIVFNKTETFTLDLIPEYNKKKTLEEIFEDLNSLVGLKNVKDMLHELVDLIELKNKAGNDLKISNTNMHMVFLGNPGTGKTTVARIVAQILYNLNYIKQNKLIEVSSKDLVAEYVGQTAPKTMAVIEKAIGGVLFIDEAYSLASGKGQGNSYNEEAIATLIQAMENSRDNLVVIFAGYTVEMQDFLNANSGIVSRIGYTVEFEDYTEDELEQIFKNMVKKAGFEITDEAIQKAKDIIKKYKNTKNFGNARFARSLYEKSVIKHASNTKGKKRKNILKTITAEDISSENLLLME